MFHFLSSRSLTVMGLVLALLPATQAGLCQWLAASWSASVASERLGLLGALLMVAAGMAAAVLLIVPASFGPLHRAALKSDGWKES